MQFQRLAFEEHPAIVGLVHPVEDVGQRRLARTVLAEQAVDLGPADCDVDGVVGDHAGEDLRHLLGDEDVLPRRGRAGLGCICHRIGALSRSFDVQPGFS